MCGVGEGSQLWALGSVSFSNSPGSHGSLILSHLATLSSRNPDTKRPKSHSPKSSCFMEDVASVEGGKEVGEEQGGCRTRGWSS